MNEFMRNVPKLGFGVMRLPKIGGSEGKTDIEHAKKMVDMYMSCGMKYFDTAYVYGDGDNEKALREILCDRYPRDSYFVASKVSAWMKDVTKEECIKQIEISLERMGIEYIDCYLLHSIMSSNLEKYDEFELWDYAKALKERGLIKYWGFSYHDNPELLDKLLSEHPDVDFVQLQLNYADWDNPMIMSRGNYEVACKYGVPVVVMEPVKGGILANPPDNVRELLLKSNPDMSISSWAIRFIASLDNVAIVLSGMSSTEQMEDNLSYMKDFKPLNAKELDVIKQAQEMINAVNTVPCTACRYCTKNCPKEIRIPAIFEALNDYLLYKDKEGTQKDYDAAIKNRARASECLKCGLCEKACPQHINIIERMAESAEIFDK